MKFNACAAHSVIRFSHFMLSVFQSYSLTTSFNLTISGGFDHNVQTLQLSSQFSLKGSSSISNVHIICAIIILISA